MIRSSRPILLILILGLATAAIHASAPPPKQGIMIHAGFITGNDYRNLSEERRRAYVMGVVDGMLLAPFFGGDKSQAKWLEACVEGMRDEQLQAVVAKYLADNPAEWNLYAHVLVYSALRESCSR